MNDTVENKAEITEEAEELNSQTGRKPAWTQNLVAIAVLLLLPFIVYFPVTSGKATFAGFDHTGINQPLKQAAFESLRNGDLPLWEHRLDKGLPLFAEGEAGIFYPLNWLFLLPGDFLTIYNIVLLLCLSIAGFLFYLWIRKLGVGIMASTIAAIAHQWSATINFNKANINILEGYILAPLAMLLLERLGDGETTPDRPLLRTFGLALVFAMMLFAGQSQYVVYTGLFCAVYILIRASFAGKNGYRVIFKEMGIPFLGGVILGAAIAGVQLVSTLELIPWSERGAYSLYESMSTHGLWLSPGRLFATFIFPAYHYSLDQFLPYLSTPVYVGPVAIMLAGYAVRFRHRLHDRTRLMIVPLLITALIFLWLAMGSNAPLSGWLTSIGPMGSFRGHGRLGGYFALVIILFMGMGLDIYLKTPPRDVCDLVGSRLCWPLFSETIPIIILLSIPFVIHRAEYLETRMSLGIMLGMIFIFITALVVGNLLNSRTSASVGVMLIVAMQIAGFYTTSSETLLTRSSWNTDRADLMYIGENSRTPDDASMIAIRTQASEGIHKRVLEKGLAALEDGPRNHIDHLGSANAGLMENLVVCNADLPLENARWEWLVHRRLWPALDNANGELDTLDKNLMDRLGINWVVTENPDLSVSEWERISEPDFANTYASYYIYRRAALAPDGSYYHYSIPKHSFYWDWKTPPDNASEQEIRDEYIDEMSSEVNPTWVYIEGLDSGDIPEQVDQKSGRASMSEWVSPTEYKVTVPDLTAPAIFVFRDQWYPGWSVTVNGERAKLLRADLVFKAVKLAPGRSEIVFMYRPSYLIPGWILSFIGLMLTIGLLFIGKIKRLSRL